MKQAADLVRALKDVIGSDTGVYAAIVKSVDKVNSVCVVELDELQIGNVRLRAMVNENATGIKFFPVVGSFVLITRLDNEEFFVAMVSEVEAVRLETDTSVLEVNNGILLKKDNDTLKDALTLIIDSVKKIMVLYGNNPDFIKLAQAQTKINNLLK